MIIYSTALLKVFLSMPHSEHCSHALTEKALGDLQRRAISPKPSPTLRVFLILFLEMICIIPFSMMKKHMAGFSSSKMNVSADTLQQNIFLATLLISAQLRLQKMKWFLRHPRRNVISWYFFYFFSNLSFSGRTLSSLWLSSLSLSYITDWLRTHQKESRVSRYHCPFLCFLIFQIITPIQIDDLITQAIQFEFIMQKKYKRAIIITIVSAIVVTLALVLSGLRQVSLDQYGLNYNRIISNYSDNTVYGPGLYLIGLANSFVKVNKNQQTISFNNLTAFTTDFYSLTAFLEVAYLFNFSTAEPFSTLSSFYEAMGNRPKDILQPLIKNEILIILSSHNSSYYQKSSIVTSELQTAISTRVQAVLSTWIGVSVSVIIESLVCEGTTSNTQIIDREISSLMHDMERVTNQKVQLSDYYTSLYSKIQSEILSAAVAINSKALILQRVLKSVAASATSLAGKNVTKTIYDNEPYNYDMNLVNIMTELIELGNRTFPY